MADSFADFWRKIPVPFIFAADFRPSAGRQRERGILIETENEKRSWKLNTEYFMSILSEIRLTFDRLIRGSIRVPANPSSWLEHGAERFTGSGFLSGKFNARASLRLILPTVEQEVLLAAR